MNIYISKTNREWINAVTTEREKRKKKERSGVHMELWSDG